METRDGIKNFRNRMRFNTQKDLADVLDVDQTSISIWESGKGFPGFQVAKKLLELGATVEEIFGVEYEKVQNLGKIDTVQRVMSEGEFKEKVKKVMETEFKTLEDMLALMNSKINSLKKKEDIITEKTFEKYAMERIKEEPLLADNMKLIAKEYKEALKKKRDREIEDELRIEELQDEIKKIENKIERLEYSIEYPEKNLYPEIPLAEKKLKLLDLKKQRDELKEQL